MTNKTHADAAEVPQDQEKSPRLDAGQRRELGRRRRPVDEELRDTFESTVDEAERRLSRSWPALLSTGAVGGIDVGVGGMALLIVREATGSELFTENFLVPVVAVVAHKSTVGATLRLWGGTAATNLLGGWVFTGLMSVGLPELHEVAVEVGSHYPELGISTTSLASAIIGGAAITLMTWMERGTDSVPGKLVAAFAIAFVLASGRLNHAIVVSLEMFAALHSGASFGYADWLGMALWAALGNMIGGLALVTVLRLVQIGRTAVREERRRPLDEPRPATPS